MRKTFPMKADCLLQARITENSSTSARDRVSEREKDWEKWWRIIVANANIEQRLKQWACFGDGIHCAFCILCFCVGRLWFCVFRSLGFSGGEILFLDVLLLCRYWHGRLGKLYGVQTRLLLFKPNEKHCCFSACRRPIVWDFFSMHRTRT